MFDHWEQMTYDPLKDDSPANVIMLDVRKRKGLKPLPNTISEYEVRASSSPLHHTRSTFLRWQWRVNVGQSPGALFLG